MPESSRAQLVFSTRHGELRWSDGTPPRIVVCDQSSDCAAVPELPFSAATGDAGRPREFTLSLLAERGRLLPRGSELLRRLDLSQVDLLRLAFRGADPLLRWADTERWVGDLERHLDQTRARIKVRYEFHTALAEVPDGFFAFAGSRLPRIVIAVTDTGTSVECTGLERQAGRLAGWGIRVQPRLCLTAANMHLWEQRAETWRDICRGASVSFLRPLTGLAHWGASLRQLPPTDRVTEFLTSIYDQKHHDLAETYPFSLLLQVLKDGTSCTPHCGSKAQAAIDCAARAFACEHRWTGDAGGTGPSCLCPYPSFCDALAAPCPALRAAAATERWRDWERLFCPAVSILIPKMMDDLAAAARFQAFLTSRSGAERFRATARDGKVRIWRDQATLPDRCK